MKKMKSTRKKILVALLASALVLSSQISTVIADDGTVQGAAGQTQEQTTEEPTVTARDLSSYLTSDTVLKIGGTAVTAGQNINVKNGDAFQIELEWAFPNSDFSVKAGDVFTYTIPAGLVFNDYSGVITNEGGSGNIGTYVISGNTITITYTQDQGSDATGHLYADGKITMSGGEDGSGSSTSYEIAGISFTLIIPKTETAASVTVEKSDAKAVEGNKFQRRFVLTVKSTGENSKVVVSDVMGSYLSLDGDSLGVYTDAACTTAADSGSYSVDQTSKGFPVTIDKMASGQTLYISYKVNVGIYAYADAKPGSKLKNTASAVSTEDTTPSTSEKYVGINCVTISKSGNMTGADSITWNITINNKDNIDLKGTTLKDVLGTALETPTAVTVMESATGSNYQTSALTASWSSLADGTFAFPEGSTKYYQITYTTKADKIPNYSWKGYTNTAYLNVFGDTSDQRTDKTVYVGNTVISKTALPNLSASRTITWLTTIAAPASVGIPAGTVLEDTLSQITANPLLGQTMIFGENGSGIKIYTDSSCTTEYKGSYTVDTTFGTVAGGGFKITFNDAISSGQKLYVKYQSQIMDGVIQNAQFKNTAKLIIGSESQNATGTYNFLAKQQRLSKSADGSGSGILKWSLTINRDGTENLNATSSVVTINDTLPENTTFDASSVKAYNINTEAALTGVTAAADESGNVVFTVTGDGIKALIAKNRVRISYSTKITDMSKIDGQTDFVNKAKITIDGVTDPEVTATNTYDGGGLVDKTAVYNQETAPYANYTIKVNPGALDLDPSSTSLVLTDKMGTALSPVSSSIKITTADGTISNVSISELGSKGYSFKKSDDGVLTITVPDSTALTITYQARVTLAAGTDFNETNGSNTVTLNGYKENQDKSEVTFTGAVQSSRAGGKSSYASITIDKQDAADSGKLLTGAEFKLDKLTVTSANRTGTTWTYSDVTTVADDLKTAGTTAGSYEAASYGKINFDNIYRITETAAPAGYNKDAEPQYFIFLGKDSGSYDNYKDIKISDNGKTYNLTVIPAGTVFNAFTMSDSAIPTTTKVKFSKTAVNGTSELAGASLKVTEGESSDGTLVKEWKSTETQQEIELDRGKTYTMTETSAPSGYIVADAITFRITDDGIVEIKTGDNTWSAQSEALVRMQDSAVVYPVTTEEKISKTVSKVWADSDNKDGIRPESIQVQLYANGVAYGAPVTLTAATGWTCTFTELPKIKDNSEVVYSVGELTSASGYTSSYSADGMVITNTHFVKVPDSPNNNNSGNNGNNGSNGGGGNITDNGSNNNTGNGGGSDNPLLPVTGDNNPLMLYVLLALTAGALAFTLARIRKSENR